jgi:hypothetical protein
MDREDIIRMAREAGLGDTGVRGAFIFFQSGTNGLERFATLVAAAEREACASICFQEGPSIDGELIAEAIRARGNT